VLPSLMKLLAVDAMRSRAANENSANRVPRSSTWDLHWVKSGVSSEARVTYLMAKITFILLTKNHVY
jgi:hypothetical protein